jgi:hypothetical protein
LGQFDCPASKNAFSFLLLDFYAAKSWSLFTFDGTKGMYAVCGKLLQNSSAHQEKIVVLLFLQAYINKNGAK